MEPRIKRTLANVNSIYYCKIVISWFWLFIDFFFVFFFCSYNQSTDFIGEELSLNPLKLDELSKSAAGGPSATEDQLQVSEDVIQNEKNKFKKTLTYAQSSLVCTLADLGFFFKLFLSRCREVYSFLGIWGP